MTDTADQVKDALLDAVVELAERRQHASGASVAGDLLRHYFGHAPLQDLTGKDPIDLYAATIRHMQLAERRADDACLVRIYNPNSDEDGWSSSHTVIDIVGKDMPFIVDSVLALLERLNYQVHVLVHPMFEVKRTAAGELRGLKVPEPDSTDLESVLHIEIDRLTVGQDIDDLEQQLRSVLHDVRLAVEDWLPMRAKVLEIADELDEWHAEGEAGAPRFEADIGGDAAEVAALLRWMEEGSFTFVGYREYLFRDDAEHPTVASIPESGLGTLRQTERTERDLGLLPAETAAQARRPNILNLTKANTLSTVHRAVPLDYVGIKKLDREGNVIGERRILGMFTSSVYSGRVEEIPTIRVKVKEVTDRAAFHSESHDYNRLLNTLQTYPRDELFQIDVDELTSMAMAILDQRDRRQVRMLMRRDLYGRYLSCLVFVPRDRYNTDVRLKIQHLLTEAYQGTSVRFSTEISDAPLARLHLVIYHDPRSTDELPDTAAVEARLVQATRTWDDYLRSSLVDAHGEDRGLDMLRRYGEAFDPSYRAHVLAESTVHDIERLQVLDTDEVDVFLHRPLEAARLELRCKVYRAGDPIVLSRLIPLLHDLGAVVIDEHPYEVRPLEAGRRFIYDIGLKMPVELDRDDRRRVRDAVLAVWHGYAESDRLAKLVVSAGLTWRDVTVLRAYTRYLTQIRNPFSFGYIVETLNNNPPITRQLIDLFHAGLDPDPDVRGDQEAVTAGLFASIESVQSLDADRILRSFATLIQATVRTNHWQQDDTGSYRAALALKLDPRLVPDMPKPAPTAEIFVYSPRTEGVHLRAGRVARGGLRWSERMEDYRTEILGLMKAQSVKNSVIVPVGAKGGFIARHLPVGGSRDAILDEIKECYEIFVGALLDVTDNVVDETIVPPDAVIRRDGDDPYLVVAADKGTAALSDTANALATGRGFWLDDAFASGGSDGYDHKALGITAYGAWVSVGRHFRELGMNPTTSPFSAVGVGDMSGDVFGNGLLRSDKTNLIAAFDHRNIFIDPDPDPATSFSERKRLFELDRSTWADYNPELISPGGGVFDRSAKSIDLTQPIRAALGLEPNAKSLTPDELIQAVLRAPVDLLWNGGIGTYVRASTETDLEIGDRGNDPVRVAANELRCKVIAEGGNLGVSQKGRIEYASLGGRINTDAIDNSGGVDCSDHEVNLKILLSVAERNGDLTRKHRNMLLESMADDVCEHVLRTNYEQNEALSAAVVEAPGMVEVHERLMQWLESGASLDRSVEELPTAAELRERRGAGGGLTRPELAVLMAYTKNTVTERLTAGNLATNGAFDGLLFEYFPRPVCDQHAELVRGHPLRNELVAMLLSNQVVNRGGISMIHRLIDETSATVADICLAHLAAWQIYDLGNLTVGVRNLDYLVVANIQTQLSLAITRLGERATRWLLRNEPQPIDVSRVIERYTAPIQQLQKRVSEAEQPDDVAAQIKRFVDEGVPEGLAIKISSLGTAYGFLDLTDAASNASADLGEVAALHSVIDDRLDLSRLREWIVSLPRDDHWETMARSALRDQYFLEHAELTATVAGAAITAGDAHLSPDDQVDRWLAEHAVAVERCRRTFAEIQVSTDHEHDLAHASVAVRALTQLRRST